MTTPSLLVAASLLAVATGAVHSLLGEWLIFRHLRTSSVVPRLPAPPLHGRHVRFLWATWHLASVLAWCFAALLWQIAQHPADAISARTILAATAAGFISGSALVLFATRGRHPGWVALGAVGILSWMAIDAT